MRKIERALISVSDKTGIVEFARALSELGVEIISTGGTAAALRNAGVVVTDVSSVTGFPEMLDGRVKTLHPKIHGGLLAKRDDPKHMEALENHSIGCIDLAAVNLYPFRETAARPDSTYEEIIENIDMGGPAMIRSAAKNHQDVVVVVDHSDYEAVISELSENDCAASEGLRRRLAARAFAHTARYDLAVAGFFAELAGKLSPELGAADSELLPKEMVLSLEMKQTLRYGENPHQSAALYFDALRPEQGIASAEQLQGKEISYNNLVDMDAAWALISEFSDSACAIIKHTNPCGAALGANPLEAFEKALASDPVSAFGGIAAFNRTVDEETALALSKIFLEVVIAPNFLPEALNVLSSKKNLRLIRQVDNKEAQRKGKAVEIRKIGGGYLAQSKDEEQLQLENVKTVTKREPTKAEWEALDFAWKICKHVKSNAIVYARDGQLVGMGAGQTSRVDSVKFGAMKAHLPLAGTALASDAFFPFRDGIDEAAKHGITAVIQPGGSVRDEEAIAAADEHNLAMVFTGVRHFKH